LLAWTQQSPGWAFRHDPTNRTFQLREVTEVARHFMNTTEFTEMQLAAFLQSPEVSSSAL
jgi:hypothetical protein